MLQEDAAIRIQAVLRGRASRKQARAVALRELDVLRISPLVPSRLLLADFGHAGAYVKLIIKCMQGRNNICCFAFGFIPGPLPQWPVFRQNRGQKLWVEAPQ